MRALDRSMSLIEHFSHEHPLMMMMVGEKDEEGEKLVVCHGCQEPIDDDVGTAAYRCSNDCDYYLHKKCAELPKQIQHIMHDDHPLFLLAAPPPEYAAAALICCCQLCKRKWSWFTYNCRQCELDICVRCASEDDRLLIHHQAHHHPLSFVRRESCFICDACDTEVVDSLYVCNTCPFWMDKECAASLPILEKAILHDHPLILAYFLPDIYCTFPQNCKICYCWVRPYNWLYYCAKCRYFVHLRCAQSSKPEENTSIRGADDVDKDMVVQFPMSKEAQVQLTMNQSSKSLSLIRATTAKSSEIVRVENCSHVHPLIPMDKFQSNNDTRELLCNGCVQPISKTSRFYGCGDCNFYLHDFCAILPTKIQHPSHPDHLLQFKFHSNIFDYHRCSACQLLCNGFAYKCDHGESCKFVLDIRCSLLPNTIKHLADHDKHSLVQGIVSSRKERCRACGFCMIEFEEAGAMGFGTAAEEFGYYIHQKCALLPTSIRHRLDPEHDIPLMYPPFMDYYQEVYCEICEEEIDTNYWLYHCRKCDMSFHIQCIDEEVHNIKFGDKIKFDIHRHVLAFTQVKTPHIRSSCARCCLELPYQLPVLECAQCEFLLCTSCARTIL